MPSGSDVQSRYRMSFLHKVNMEHYISMISKNVNAVKLRNPYPLQKVGDFINSLEDAEINFTIDATRGCHQNEAQKVNNLKIVFTLLYQFYQFKHTRLGLSSVLKQSSML